MKRRTGALSALTSILGKRGGIDQIVRYRARQKLKELTGTEIRRKRDEEMSYGQGTLTRSKRRYGRNVRRGTTKYARLYTRAATQRNVWGLSDYTKFGGVNGSIYLQNWYNTSTGTDYYVPLHLWDVTACNNNVAGTVQGAQVGARLSFNSPIAPTTVKWRTMSNPLQAINTGHAASSTANTPNAASLYRGFSAKFMFYAPQTIPTRITIRLIQILGDQFHPPKAASGLTESVGLWQADNTALPDQASYSTVNFWESAVAQYAYNPVIHGDGNMLKQYMKVVKSHSFILNPKETSDNTATTYHQFTMFHRFNRRNKYNWLDSGVQDLITDDEDIDNRAVNKCCVQPKARYYLMVTGDSVYNTGATEVKTGAPSYDISLRFYHDDAGS